MKVLLVDDSRTMRNIQKRCLLDAFPGCAFAEAGDGTEALTVLSTTTGGFDLVLVDWNMPNMDGYEFLRSLRKLPGGDAPKVVFCTTENDVAHIARALHAGANEYIMKPFDREIVEAKFQEVGLI